METELEDWQNDRSRNNSDGSPGPLSIDRDHETGSNPNDDTIGLLRSVSEKTSEQSGSSTSLSKLDNESHRVTVSWKNLSVHAPIRPSGLIPKLSRSKEWKQVLKNVSGIVYPGSLVAVMGASGAGKTTLLNVLAYRHQKNLSITGDMLANGVPIGKFLGHVSGYVYQEDLFYSTLTVSEHLHFMAQMKLDRRLSKADRDLRVEELLAELSLKKTEHTRIGMAGVVAGISGGERKRLAFATEILTDPPLLFLDECTTGLDSFSAQRIIEMLRIMAARGKTIICTIHQPSSQVFAMFDQLCLLAEGRIAYLGKSQDALPFLQTLNFVFPDQFNTAEFLIKTLAVHPGKEEESLRTINRVCDAFAVSEMGLDMRANIRHEFKSSQFLDLSGTSDASFGDQYIAGKKQHPPLWGTKTACLFWRSMTDSFRSVRSQLFAFLVKLISALIYALCFYGLTMDQEAIQDVSGICYMMVAENSYASFFAVLHTFPTELPLFLRENKAGLYRVDSYYLSKFIAIIPRNIISPLIFCTLTYWIVGLRNTPDAFAYTCLAAIMMGFTASACGCLFSIMFDKYESATSIFLIYDFVLALTSGLYLNVASLPLLISWLKYVSWFFYGNEINAIIQWEGVTDIACSKNSTTGCVKTGEEVLITKSYDIHHWSEDFIGIAALFFGFHIVAYFALLSKSNRR